MISTRLLGATALVTSLALTPAAALAQQTGSTSTQNSPAGQAEANPQASQGTPSPADQSAGTGTPGAGGESQTPQADNGNASTGSGDVLVTGTRIARPNLDSSVPVTAITAADLTDTGNLSLGDELNKLPQLRATFSQSNSTRNIGTAGLNELDLRGLGTARTLVLVNGRRHVSAVPGSLIVDVNTIPNALLDSVEVVTGGTSAVYGSDAIAGVVNFKLKTDFQGIEARVQSGVSSRNDRGSYFASLVAGQNFADNRGNIAGSIEYARSNTVLFSDRNKQTGALTGAPGFYTTELTQRLNQTTGRIDQLEGPGGDGTPDTSYFTAFPGGVFGNRSIAGTIATTCPAANGTLIVANRRAAVCTGTFSPTTGTELQNFYQFSDDGQTLFRDLPTIDLRTIGGGLFGGRSATGLEGAELLPGLSRVNANLLFNYEVSPALRVFGEGKYVHVIAFQQSTQPTFTGGALSATFFLDNPFLTAQERSTLQTILGTTSTTAGFTLNRFNNDIGTRAENHIRDTYRGVIGVKGDISDAGHVNYELSFNYGRTNTYYETGGNVDNAKFNAAANAALATDGSIQCRINTDRLAVPAGSPAGTLGALNTANDMPGCVPLNLFGQFQESQAALNYVLYKSRRAQNATEIDVIGSVAGDSSMLFSLPAGGIGFAVGGEYRREGAYSDYDDFTQAGNTFLNSIATFAPPKQTVKEAFGELRVPILKDMFFNELTLEGAARYSKYNTQNKGVVAYNYGAIFAPIHDLRFRAGYARAVRSPNLSELFATASQTFANGFIDPCSQTAIPNAVNPTVRAANCAAAGIPTTFSFVNDAGVTLTQPFINTAASGISGVNAGNPNLRPEISNSLTVGGIFEPSFLKGFSLTVDYYRIKVKSVIAGLAGQTIINQCYDDPGGINNQYCALITRRTSTNPVVNYTFAGQSDRVLTGVSNNGRDFVGVPIGISFLNAPLNYALLKTSGIDGDLSYNHLFPNGVRISYRGLLSWLHDRYQYTSVSVPTQATRLNGVLGDPTWRGQFSANISYKGVDFGYDLNYIGRQSYTDYEVQHTFQGRGPTNLDLYPISELAPQLTHDFQLGFRVNKNFRAYVNVDNALDTLPPYGLTGTGAASGIFNVVGRFFSAGVNLRY